MYSSREVFAWAKESCLFGTRERRHVSKIGLLRDLQHRELWWDIIITHIPNLIFKIYDQKHDFVKIIVNLPSNAAYPQLSNYPCHEFVIRMELLNTNPQASLSKNSIDSLKGAYQAMSKAVLTRT